MYLLTNINFLFLQKLKAFVWSDGNNCNGTSYHYASNCDFPGDNIIPYSCAKSILKDNRLGRERGFSD